MTWVLGHEDHDVDERGGAFFCRTCDREVPKTGDPQIDLPVQPVAQDDDIGADVTIFKKEW